MQIFQAVANRIPIEQELLSARHLDKQSWKDPKEGRENEALVPFPMITTCLNLGASFDPTDGYLHGVDIEPFGMEYDEGDNNNGITVIDISELHNVRYCFTDILAYGMESQTPVPLMTPLSASTYLWSYYDKNNKEHQEMHRHVIDQLEKWDLIDVAALQDTWPMGTWRDADGVEASGDEEGPGDEEASEEEEQSTTAETSENEEHTGKLAKAGDNGHPFVQTSFSADHPPIESSNDSRSPEEPPTSKLASLSIMDAAATSSKQAANQSAAGPHSLRDSAMNTMIEAALGQSETDLMLWMPEAELLTDFGPSLRRKLYEDPTVLKTSQAGLYLLCRALEGELNVDLSAPLKILSIKDISLVISKLRQHGNIRSVVLSNLPELREEDLHEAFQGERCLRALYLIETPHISINSIVSFANSYLAGLQDLYHTELLRRPLKLKLRRWQREEKIAFSANPVNQMLWATCDAVRLSKNNMRLENGLIDWQKLSKEEGPYSRKPVYSAFPLDDVLLPPVKFVTGLLNFMNWAARCECTYSRSGAHDYGLGAANSFAMAKSSIRGRDYQVGPLPSALHAARTKSYPTKWPFAMSVLVPGKWAIVVLHESLSVYDAEDHPNVKAKIRYAMITTRDSLSKDVVVADMSTFLEEVMKVGSQAESDFQELHGYWTEQCEGMLLAGHGIELCGEQEVRDLLQTFFAEDNPASNGRDSSSYYLSESE